MCFLIGATGPGITRSGEAVIGGVSDDPYLFRTFVRIATPKKAVEGAAAQYAHVGTELRYDVEQENLEPPFEVEPGQPSRGINSCGLSFTCALAIERDVIESDVINPPVLFSKLCHDMMDTCSTVEEAVELFSDAGAVSPAFSLLLADSAGSLVQMEVGAFGCVVYERFSKTNPGIVIAVNCYQSSSLKCFNKDEARLSNPNNNNLRRLQRGRELADRYKGELDVNTLGKILSDHKNRDKDCSENSLIKFWGHSICNHGTKKAERYDFVLPPWGTVSSEILQPSRKTLYYNYGWPCGEGKEYGDQSGQGNSWGKFRAFALPSLQLLKSLSGESQDRFIECTKTDGTVTDFGNTLAFIDRSPIEMQASPPASPASPSSPVSSIREFPDEKSRIIV